MPLVPVASDSLSPGFIRFAARPPGFAETGLGDEPGIDGDETQFLVFGRATGGSRPARAPAKGPLTTGGDCPPGLDRPAGGIPGRGVLGTVPVEAAWGKVGGAPCREREKAFIFAKISWFKPPCDAPLMELMEACGRGGVPAPLRAALIWPKCVDDAVMPGILSVGRKEGTEAGGVVTEGERSSSVVSDLLSKSLEGETPATGSISDAIVLN